MNLDPSLQTAIAAGLERAVNAALRYDPATKMGLAKLEGQVMAIEIVQPSATFYVVPGPEGVAIQSVWDGEVTTQIRGTPPALLALVRSSTTSLADAGVEVFGNTGMLMELHKLLQNLEIDWEAAVNDVVGDIFGHELSTWVRRGAQWAQSRKASFERLLGEFLTEEYRATPSKSEMNHFSQGVDEARLQADRVKAKLDALRQRRTQAESDDDNSSSPLH